MTTWESLKFVGNKFYGEGKFSEAIREYTRAIQHNVSESTLFSNRALCHLRLGDFTSAKTDAHRAAELNGINTKALYVLGRCYSEMDDLDKAVTAYRRCLETSGGADASKALYHEVFGLYFTARRQQHERMRGTMLDGLNERMNSARVTLSAVPPAADSLALLEQLHAAVESSRTIEIFETVPRPNALVLQANPNDFVTQIPDCFMCPILLEVMRDPVIAVSLSTPGHFSGTYERSSLLKHFQFNGFFDPVSRIPLGPGMPTIVPN